MDNQESQVTSILQMAKGAFMERTDYELKKMVSNILDPNTKPDAKRVISIKITLLPDKQRQAVQVQVATHSTPAPVEPVGTTLMFAGDANGELVLKEIGEHAPGQMFLNGEEQEQPKIVALQKSLQAAE